MKYEYLKGSEKDFEGAPAWAYYLASIRGRDGCAWVSHDDNKYQYIRDVSGQVGREFSGSLIKWERSNGVEIIAERQPITEPSWDGVSLPPVGCECEFTLGPYEPDEFDDLVGKLPWPGTLVTVVSHKVTGDGHDVAVIYWDDDGGGRAACLVGSCLKPIRSEADKKREAVIESLMRIVCGPSQASATVNKLYTAIAAGKIPGVKLED